MTPPSTLTPDQEAALKELEREFVEAYAATSDPAKRQAAVEARNAALLALNLESEDESEFGFDV